MIAGTFHKYTKLEKWFIEMQGKHIQLRQGHSAERKRQKHYLKWTATSINCNKI